MKLIYRITLRIAALLTLVLLLWGSFFYFAIIDEINDETDDVLEDYAEQIILRTLRGEDLPKQSSGSNNQFFLQKVSSDYLLSHPAISYADSMVYIKEKRELEPARIYTTVFQNQAGEYHILQVFTPTIEKNDLIESILFWTVFLYGSLLLSIVLLLAFVFYRSMLPLYKLLRWIDVYRVGVNNEPLNNETNISEFKKLNEAVIRYAHRNESFFEQQKQFIGNASHEMQTPVAICRNRLEMLMEEGELNQHQTEELGKTYQTLEQMSRLTKSLLLLSRIDNGQYSEQQHICMNSVLCKALPDYEEVFGASKSLRVRFSETANFCLEANESLMSILCTNLLKNAFIHCEEGGEVSVDCYVDGILFKNTGTSALDGTRIFQRFYQGSKKEGSTGLGLAIAQSICRIEGLSLTYSYEQSMHCFRIKTIGE